MSGSNGSNGARSAASTGRTVAEIVAAQISAGRSRLAVVDGDRTLTYAALEARANVLAHHLRRHGAERDRTVALVLPRSADLVIAVLATLRSGAACVPVDPAVPVERVAATLADARPCAIVTRRGLAARMPRGAWHVVALDRDGAEIERHPTSAPDGACRPSDVVYLVYGPASASRPEREDITHASLLKRVLWQHATVHVTPGDRAPLMSSSAFDAVVWEIWPYLTAGASLHVPDDVTCMDPEALRDWLVAHAITIGFVPTPVAERLIALPWPTWTALRTLLTGADTLHRYPPDGLPFVLVNNYGPTECTVVTTSGPVEPEPFGETLPTIGRPIDNVDVLILDEAMRPVAPDAAGELYIGGAGLARGYRGRPDLTAERFVPHPDEPGARLYRTGDRARLLADGRVAFLGRVDDQVKIRGYRVEPDEIAAALGAQPGVAACAVVARDDDGGERRLVAYVVAAPGAALGREALGTALRRSLPDYMVPATFVVLSSLPLTTNGKVDRAALPAPDASNTLRDGELVAPRTEVETELAAILSALLAVEGVSVEDNFFLLGGHSLLGTQLIVRVRDVFGVELSLRTLFDAPTIADLAAEIERARLAEAA